MSTLSNYYESNLKENPYTMEGTKLSSRVTFLKEWIEKYAKPGQKILDVGCGDMFLAKELPQYDWTGIDINTQVNDSKCIKQDLEKFPYPFPKESFDVVVCSEVLEHLYDPVLVTQEIKRLLRPDGTYILSTPNFDWAEHFFCHFRPLLFDPSKSWTKEHIHVYNLASHDLILERAGLKRIEYRGADPHFGYFFKDIRLELKRFLEISGMSPDEAIPLADVIISRGFKDYMHTIMIVAKHG